MLWPSGDLCTVCILYMNLCTSVNQWCVLCDCVHQLCCVSVWFNWINPRFWLCFLDSQPFAAADQGKCLFLLAFQLSHCYCWIKSSVCGKTCSFLFRGAKSLLLLDSFVSFCVRGRSFCAVQKSLMISRGYPVTKIRSRRVFVFYLGNSVALTLVIQFLVCPSLLPNYTYSIQPNERECNRKESNDFNRLENKFIL